MKEKYSFKKSCENGAKEIFFIYEAVGALKFNEVPNYDNYIYLLENYINYIKINTGKTECEIAFDWEEKIIEEVKKFGGVQNYIKYDKEISELFKGYPNFFVENLLEKYSNAK